MPDGRPKGFPSTRLEMKPPYGLAVAISDHQDGSFEQQEVSGRDVVASAKIIAVQRKRWIRRRWAGQEIKRKNGRNVARRLGVAEYTSKTAATGI